MGLAVVDTTPERPRAFREVTIEVDMFGLPDGVGTALRVKREEGKNQIQVGVLNGRREPEQWSHILMPELLEEAIEEVREPIGDEEQD